jgi:membrane protein DedA with SNARE-associated domain
VSIRESTPADIGPPEPGGAESDSAEGTVTEAAVAEALVAEALVAKAAVGSGGAPADGANADSADADGTAGAGRAEKSPWEDPRMPWTGKPGKADVLCLLAILLSGVYYYALLPFRAHLLGTHPVVSEMLNGSTEAIISAAAFARIGHGTVLVAVLAAIPGLMKFDIVYWWAGKLWGAKYVLLVAGRSKRGLKYMERVERSGRRFTWPAMVLAPFIPFGIIIYIIAGATGMSWITFLVLDLIGNLFWTGLLVGLGYALGNSAVHVAKEVSHYSLYTTVGLIVLVVFFQVRSQRRMLAEVRAQATAVRDEVTAEVASDAE